MFAVIKTGGKQYRVSADDELTIEKLSAEPGDLIQFDHVLMIGEGDAVSVGAPTLKDAGVTAEVVEQTRGEKVYTFHKRRRNHSSKRLRGHRQYLTVVKIKEILRSGASTSGAASADALTPSEEPAVDAGAQA